MRSTTAIEITFPVLRLFQRTYGIVLAYNVSDVVFGPAVCSSITSADVSVASDACVSPHYKTGPANA